jgi:NDP-sugar pyrophosphorylase family protein
LVKGVENYEKTLLQAHLKCLILSAMGNDITVSCNIQVGTGFVPKEFLKPGEDEYTIRNQQIAARGKVLSNYRRLLPFELETLVRNHNTCSDWSLFFVSEPFTPELVHNTFFSGLIRIGRLERISLEHHDLHLFAGISNSHIISCDIGDNCVISNCTYIAHYIIGDYCILIDNGEIHVSNHSKFGNGCLVEGESEDIRIMIDVMNEAGGRSIYPFDGMTCADAYLWARHRENSSLMKQFESMTEAIFTKKRGTYGSIGDGSVLKSNGVIKDVVLGESSYVKGANKLKNLTINSREDARTQIGEGVELVNGIIGFGCKVFYGCKAVRFVMCDNSSLKYGARLIHSVLGENSTVSCCEILNNLIFPAHEQHHNTSFLIASLVKGQSNMAAGATIGSNHNSRAPDGEIEAGRGFWPGLCTSVKHSSRFASFCLLAKGDYRYELDIPFPFCLVDNDYKQDRLVLIPAYWWTSNLYALMRNEAKFKARDNRFDKSIYLEFSPFAPDTAYEMMEAIRMLEKMTGLAYERYCDSQNCAIDKGSPQKTGHEILSSAKGPLPFEVKADHVENSKRDCILARPEKAWRAYREMLLWFVGREIEAATNQIADSESMLHSILEYFDSDNSNSIENSWENLGGLLVSKPRMQVLLSSILEGCCPTWPDLHRQYEELSVAYPKDRSNFAWSVLGMLYPHNDSKRPSLMGLKSAIRDLEPLVSYVEMGVLKSKAKDWDNPYRRATFRSEEEMTAVLGRPENNSFIKKCQKDMAVFRQRLRSLAQAIERQESIQ